MKPEKECSEGHNVHRGGDPFFGPAVVYANRFQFASGETVDQVEVWSRALIWGISGQGRIRSRGRQVELSPGTLVALPWTHDTHYLADTRDPFLVGAVHLVPRLAGSGAIEPRAAHSSADPLSRDRTRQDATWQGLSAVETMTGPSVAGLIRLCESVVSYFERGPADSGLMRAYGTVIVDALQHATPKGASHPRVPSALSRAIAYASSHLEVQLSNEQLAAVADCSVSSLERQFRDHLASSPQSWLREARLDRAAIRLRTSSSRINEVAREVGINDPHHFSRIFRARFGTSPREYARRELLL